MGYVTQSMAREKMVVNERAANAELADLVRDGTVGVGTPVCVDINEARDKLLRVRSQMVELAKSGGFRLIGAGTHPFSRWEGREETLAQYRQMAEDTQMVSRRVLAFGLRIHIGVEDRDLAVDVMNTLRYVLPHIFALSTSSPFWLGRNTGLKSYRAVLDGLAAPHRDSGLLLVLPRLPQLRRHAAAHQLDPRRTPHHV